MSFISFRRELLDRELFKYQTCFKGQILDVGGVKIRRGRFQIPKNLDWKILNKDPKANADIVGELPIIPCPNESFDQIVMTEVLEYIPQYLELLKECHRVLKANGEMFISFPFLSPLHGDKEWDALRLTPTYFEKIIAPYFKIQAVTHLGGPVCVFLDCLRSQWFTHGKSHLIHRLCWKMIGLVSALTIKSEQLFFTKNAGDSSTGPFYHLKKITLT